MTTETVIRPHHREGVIIATSTPSPVCTSNGYEFQAPSK